MPGFIIDVLN